MPVRFSAPGPAEPLEVFRALEKDAQDLRALLREPPADLPGWEERLARLEERAADLPRPRVPATSPGRRGYGTRISTLQP